jgi:hypothetical protein
MSGSDAPANWVYPDYRGGSIVNLMSSILSACGATPGAYPPLRELDAGQLRSARHLVLLVLDGLGYEYLRAQAQSSVLRRHLRGRISSVAPPTTATAVTGFLTGQAPQQHGLTGWFTWFRELGTVLAVLPFTPRCGDQPLGKAGVSAADLFGHVPVFDRLSRNSWSVSPEWIIHSDFNRAHLGRARPVPYRSLQQCFAAIARVVRQTDGQGYIYAYWPGFDRLAHEVGVGSEAVAEHFAELDVGFARLLESLAGTDTLVMVTADHGFVDVLPEKRVGLADHPVLKDCLVLPLCGEQRLGYAYVRADRRRTFEDYVQEHLSHFVDCYPSAVLLEQNLFGLGEPHPELWSRIGDYVLVMKPGCVIQDPIPGEKPARMTGFHGGLSAAEMYVPFIVAEC